MGKPKSSNGSFYPPLFPFRQTQRWSVVVFGRTGESFRGWGIRWGNTVTSCLGWLRNAWSTAFHLFGLGNRYNTMLSAIFAMSEFYSDRDMPAFFRSALRIILSDRFSKC